MYAVILSCIIKVPCGRNKIALFFVNVPGVKAPGPNFTIPSFSPVLPSGNVTVVRGFGPTLKSTLSPTYTRCLFSGLVMSVLTAV